MTPTMQDLTIQMLDEAIADLENGFNTHGAYERAVSMRLAQDKIRSIREFMLHEKLTQKPKKTKK